MPFAVHGRCLVADFCRVEKLPYNNTMEPVLISWETPEYPSYQKNSDWYWWVGLMAALLMGLAFWQRSFLFGVFILVAWFSMMLYAVRPPKNIQVSITMQGIVVDTTLYPWTNIKSFWIFYRPPLTRDLSLESKKALAPYIKIPLGETDPTKVKNIVLKFIPEVEQTESIVDNLSHLARF